MARTYTVCQSYSATFHSAGGARSVTLAEGEKVELDDDVAEFVERDAPGTLAGGRAAAADADSGRSDSGGIGDGLDGLTKKELEALAAERGVEVSKRAKKDELIEALRAPDEEPDDSVGSAGDEPSGEGEGGA